MDTRKADLERPPMAPAARHVLLGTEFDQAVLHLQPGPVTPQVVAATGIPQEHLVCWVQKERFIQPTVQGVPVHRAIGFRDRRTFVQRDAPAVFIDARTLGRPLCCRVLHSRISDVWGLLNAVGVSLPDKLQPEWVGGAGVLLITAPRSSCGPGIEARLCLLEPTLPATLTVDRMIAPETLRIVHRTTAVIQQTCACSAPAIPLCRALPTPCQVTMC